MALPPLGKGGKSQIGDILMFQPQRKHNTALTPRAKTLRKNMTPEERRLWHCFLKTYPIRILRQKVIDDYIVDFYCHEAKLAIEIDGSQHYTEEGLWRDEIRTENIANRGISVIRIPNNAVNQNFSEVCDYIDQEIKKRLD